MPITADIQKLEPGALVELFELDASEIGGAVQRFHGYMQVGAIHWQGKQYDPWSIQAEGFEQVGEGQQPSPTLRVGNIGQDEKATLCPASSPPSASTWMTWWARAWSCAARWANTWTR